MSGRRDSVLREMGLAPLWRLRDRPAVDDACGQLADAVVDGAPLPAERSADTVPVAAGAVDLRIVPPLHSDARRGHAGLPPLAAGVAPAVTPEHVADGRIEGLDWDALEATIRTCEACVLCQKRKQAVPGVGDRQADWLFVGEGPGAEEDERGEPFVGQAGRLLDAMLASIDLRRGHDVYIANAVKCRPPHNRTPETAEIAACFPYLERQIALLQPRLIVALGRPAAQALLNQEIKIGASRGRLFRYGGIPVIVTYHPAYLLRNLHDKGKVWEDLCFARRTMAELHARADAGAPENLPTI
ncbi:MAG TPA: uracil-DNA glycosylase [Rhodocyclaceae bacterium]|nr:uracil-DNA glycosylase [Rhodocyclaceae bacterium]